MNWNIIILFLNFVSANGFLIFALSTDSPVWVNVTTGCLISSFIFLLLYTDHKHTEKIMRGGE